MFSKTVHLTLSFCTLIFKLMMKIAFLVFSIALLIYMLWPAPSQMSQFPALPNSEKSTLEGDTIQIPNVSAYFSNNFRKFVIPFYADHYQNLTGLPFSPMRLNYPPEYSWSVIKKHTDSTYLEELTYPLKDSLYVNGLEPFNENGDPKWLGATKFEIGKNIWLTKVTLRFYPSGIFSRFVIWLGIIVSTLLLYKLGRKIIFEKYG